MTRSLPLRANLEWLKKESKDRLAELRRQDPNAKLAHVQLALAREYGFPSWRKLKERVEQMRGALDAVHALDAIAQATAADSAVVPPDDAQLAELFAAVNAGDTQGVLRILSARPALAKAHGPDGQTALHVAAECNDPKLAVVLLECGADPNAKYGDSAHTAFSWAVTCKSIEFGQALVRLGHKPDLFCAAGIGSLDAVRSYFDESGVLAPGASRTGSSRFGPDGTRLPCPPSSPREQISDALYAAARNGQAEVVRDLLGHQPDLKFKAYMGGTCLHWAHFSGSREVVTLLEQAGADPDARDDVVKCTPRAFGICAPANWGFVELVRKRLQEDPTLANLMEGTTSPLHEAARSGSLETVQALLDAGASPKLRDGNGKLPSDIATERHHEAIFDLLRQATAPE